VSPTTSPRAAAAAADEFPAFDAFDAFGSGGPPAPAPAPSTVVAGQSAADDFFASMMSAPAPAPTQPQQPAPAMTMMGTVQPSRGSTQGGMSGGGGGDLISGFSSAPAPAANRCGLPACLPAAAQRDCPMAKDAWLCRPWPARQLADMQCRRGCDVHVQSQGAPRGNLNFGGGGSGGGGGSLTGSSSAAGVSRYAPLSADLFAAGSGAAARQQQQPPAHNRLRPQQAAAAASSGVFGGLSNPGWLG
jgi:hypothetical protein